VQTEKFKEKLSLLPDSPGVYMFLDDEGSIIYVGKAVVLKNRIRSYFSGAPSDNKTKHLLNNIADIDYIITGSESESFIWESILIKKNQPRYNILLKDSKSYPYIKIYTTEPFPRVEITRDPIVDGNVYYGPFSNVGYMKQLLSQLEWFFPHRTCSRTIPEHQIVHARACLNLQMGKCPGPCVGKISRADYAILINKITKHILGKNDDLIREMKSDMQVCSDNLEFEKAAKLRDQIIQLEELYKKQVVYFSDFQDRDIIAYYREDKFVAVTMLRMVRGKISEKNVFSFKNTEDVSTESILRAFLIQYYYTDENAEPKLPFQILIQSEPEDYAELNVLFKKRLAIPARGEHRRLIEIARKNAFDYVESQKLSYLRKSSRTIVSVQELKNHLSLKNLPRKMVCIDISTIHGSETVASLVFFENGKPLKKHYRHFIIKTVIGQDDFASISETMDRYLKNLVSENPWEIPDLIVIDGGKGQLSSALGKLLSAQEKHETLESIEIVSIAKRLEEVFVVRDTNFESIIIPKSSPALKIITHLRDEAHRFAITHHRKRRNQRTLTSELDAIKGLSNDKKFLLLKHFGSVECIKRATLDELMAIKGIGEKLAQKIYEKLENCE
jgi:excinuclease ABC subunit C